MRSVNVFSSMELDDTLDFIIKDGDNVIRWTNPVDVQDRRLKSIDDTIELEYEERQLTYSGISIAVGVWAMIISLSLKVLA